MGEYRSWLERVSSYAQDSRALIGKSWSNLTVSSNLWEDVNPATPEAKDARKRVASLVYSHTDK
jgi:hypothetical protein